MPSNNIGWDVAIAAGFALGLALFITSSVMLRAASRRQPVISGGPIVPSWPRMVDEDLSSADVATRLDMIERLGLVPGDWSREILERAKLEESDAQLIAAIGRALDDRSPQVP